MTDETFLNPYTFIPAFPRERLPAELGDGAPPGHDRLHLGRWSGRIGVTLTVETPLLLLDTPRAVPPSKGDKEHLVYPVLLRDGRSHLPATSVKGMLRSAYEAITNSRFGVFTGHEKRLGFRRTADDARNMEPVMIGSDRKLYRFKAAKLLFYPKKPREKPVLYEDGTTPKHRDRVAAVVEKDTVRRLVRHNQVDQLTDVPAGKIVRGVVYITGPNIEGKKCERLFYRDPQDRVDHLTPEEWKRLSDAWDQLIRDYQDAHTQTDLRERPHNGRKAKPWESIGKEPGKTAWSPHIYEPLQEHVPLRQGMFCWALREGTKITGFYPVMVTRDVRPDPPEKLLDDSFLKPAGSYDQMSPADRVFGWVAPKGSGTRPSAYRGRLRIGPVTCDQDAATAVRTFTGDGLPLSILGQPKPTQARFYLSDSKNRPDKPIGDRVARADLYKGARGLRGRKAYWHHAGLPKGYWDEPNESEDPTQTPVGDRYREFRRPRKSPDDKGDLTSDARRYETTDEEQRDTQNRSILGWINPATVFRFSIDVRDLDHCELGALAWLLTLPPEHFHRLGLGKPLGFGSIRLDIDLENTELSSGEQWAEYYRSMTDPLPAADAATLLDKVRADYEALLAGSPQLTKVRDAFLAVARGNLDIPVHYPRTRPRDLASDVPTPPDPRGNSYEWFTENEQIEDRRIPYGYGRSLPSATGENAELSIYPRKDKNHNPRKSQANGKPKKPKGGGNPRSRHRGGR